MRRADFYAPPPNAQTPPAYSRSINKLPAPWPTHWRAIPSHSVHLRKSCCTTEIRVVHEIVRSDPGSGASMTRDPVTSYVDGMKQKSVQNAMPADGLCSSRQSYKIGWLHVRNSYAEIRQSHVEKCWNGIIQYSQNVNCKTRVMEINSCRVSMLVC